MSAAPSAVALSAMNNLVSKYIIGEAVKIFDNICIPVVTVNGVKSPINYEASRRHIFSCDVIIVKKRGDLLMLVRPDEFNHALDKAIHLIKKRLSK
ncbi:MAG: hypothetical protein GY787_26225 [Alteromonadales bacterium]|nr:hypothetical protein [Alteromonadales bacterium]